MPENDNATTGSNLKIIGEDPGVAAFVLMCITTAKKSAGMCITDAIVKTSIRENLNYHLGLFEFGQAKNALIKAVRFPKEATHFDKDGLALNAIPKGAHNNLLGKKIFADQDRGKKPAWCGYTMPMKGSEDAPSGRGLPVVREFLQWQETMLLLGEDDYEAEWVESKVAAKPVVRDTDLRIAIDQMKRSVELLKNTSELRAEVANLNRTVTLLTQERQQREGGASAAG